MNSRQIEIDKTIRKALRNFILDVRQVDWRGRENEAVNLFVFSHLLPRVRPRSVLHDPSQIAIECAVYQAESSPRKIKKGKINVRKDLIIWKKAKTTNWFPERNPSPLAVMEWKLFGFPHQSKGGKLRLSEHDMDWLTKFTVYSKLTVGYVVSLELRDEPRLLCCRINSGRRELINIE